ncbi:hypothetical protein Goklo_024200 [Gossypium klotzschianum]|uniref:RNase H type-1 domain-containing protein n=1 Tax=Gossypium klotzschianum TaxID=34286 RepID=A0A7J8WD04_9ROSI|nr:hypothetical protein [Gossypium klotzschianum]
MVMETACPRCGGADENVDHLLRGCPVTREGCDIAAWVLRYAKETDECETSKLTKETVMVEWCPSNGSDIKLNFDAAFDKAQAKSASGVVARNASREILTSKIVVYKVVAPPFAVETNVCLQEVLLGKQKGFTSVIIKGDSASVIKKSKPDLVDRR